MVRPSRPARCPTSARRAAPASGSRSGAAASAGRAPRPAPRGSQTPAAAPQRAPERVPRDSRSRSAARYPQASATAAVACVYCVRSSLQPVLPRRTTSRALLTDRLPAEQSRRQHLLSASKGRSRVSLRLCLFPAHPRAGAAPNVVSHSRVAVCAVAASPFKRRVKFQRQIEIRMLGRQSRPQIPRGATPTIVTAVIGHRDMPAQSRKDPYDSAAPNRDS